MRGCIPDQDHQHHLEYGEGCIEFRPSRGLEAWKSIRTVGQTRGGLRGHYSGLALLFRRNTGESMSSVLGCLVLLFTAAGEKGAKGQGKTGWKVAQKWNITEN